MARRKGEGAWYTQFRALNPPTSPPGAVAQRPPVADAVLDIGGWREAWVLLIVVARLS